MKPTLHFTPCLNFVAFDLETTGLDLEHDDIIEIAFVVFKDGKPEQKSSVLVRPSKTISPFIHRLTGISNEDVSTAEPFENAGKQFLDQIENLPLVAHNAAIDMQFLNRHLKNAGLPSPANTIFDTLLLSRTAWCTFSNHRLETLIKELNIQVEASHRALPDAEACGHLFLKAQKAISEMDDAILKHLDHIAKESAWSLLFPPLDSNQKLPEIPESTPSEIPNSTEYTFEKDLDAVFSENGTLGKVLENFAPRKGQSEFAKTINHVLEHDGIQSIEAGTGTGKTLSYLYPAAKIALEKNERIVISTGTRILQEQIRHKEIPLVEKLVGAPIQATVLKGRSNYLCLRKYEEHLKDADRLLPPQERNEFLPLIPWISKTVDGDITENSGFNQGRHRQLWSRVASETSTCVGEKCKFFHRCFALNARRKAAKSKLVIINHSLFFSDIQSDFSILPSYERIIFDEAHKLPELGQNHLGKSLRFYDLRNILVQLSHAKESGHGLIFQAEKLLNKDFSELRNKVYSPEKSMHRYFMKLGKHGRKKVSRGENIFIYNEPLSDIFDVDSHNFTSALSELIRNIQALCDELAELKTPECFSMIRDLSGKKQELEDFARDFESITQARDPKWNYWLEEMGNPHTFQMHASPAKTGTILSEKFWPWIRSAILISGSLAVKESTHYFEDKMGLISLSKKVLPGKIFPSPWNRKEQMQVLVSNAMPSPQAPEYEPALIQFLTETLPKIKKGTLVLFTNIAQMKRCYAQLAPLFEAEGRALFAQHVNGSLQNLIDFYKKEDAACLLGTGSLWEGIDLPGKLLELLVIPRLPFPSPGIARVAVQTNRLKKKNKNPFRELILPETSLELSQGIGRLIRSPEDTGTLLLLDKRILTEGYGKTLARIWDSEHKIIETSDELFSYFSENE